MYVYIHTHIHTYTVLVSYYRNMCTSYTCSCICARVLMDTFSLLSDIINCN